MIHIIGAGPAGLITAKAIRKNNPSKRVVVYEEHSIIGRPVQCTGIVTSEIHKYIAVPKKCIAKKIRTAVIHAPNGGCLHITLKKPDIVFYRDLFDQFLLRCVLQKGVEIKTGWSLTAIKDASLIFLVGGKERRVRCSPDDCIIGADGVHSTVARLANLKTKRTALMGMQYVVKKVHDEKIHFYPFIGRYAWLCPEGERTVRAGVVTQGNAKDVFMSFMNMSCGAKDMADCVVSISGRIPVFQKNISKQAYVCGVPVFLVGDSACQVKNTTGGGILAGIKAGEMLGRLISEGKEKKYSQKVWAVEKHLYLHYLLDKVFQKFSSDDWNDLIAACNNPRLKNAFARISRDDLWKLLITCIIKDPFLLRYCKFFFKE